MIQIDTTILQPGDVGLVRSGNLFSTLHYKAINRDTLLTWDNPKFKMRPSSHNLIFGYNKKNEPCFFESLFAGFVDTPIKTYDKELSEGNCELKLARLSGGLPLDQQDQANIWLNEHLNTSYDIRAYISLIWRLCLRLPPIINTQNKAHFWCTEAYAEMMKSLNYKILPEMPCPYSIEKLIVTFILDVVAEY